MPLLFGLKGQLVAEVGMRDGDELAGTLTEAAAAQVRHAVLGDNIIDIVLARRDDGARRENGLDLADRAALGRGGEGDEALAAAGTGRRRGRSRSGRRSRTYASCRPTRRRPDRRGLTSTAALMEIMLSFWQMTFGSLT